MSFLKALVDDREKSINPAHVITLALVTGVLFWVTFVVVKTHAIPDVTGCAYLIGGSSAVNLAHKAEDILDKIKAGQQQGQGGQ